MEATKAIEESVLTLRTRMLGLPIVLVILTTACLGESQRPPCDCPNTEAAVTSIDWLADGRIAEKWGSNEGFAGEPAVWQEFKRFDGADEAIAAFEGLLARLEDAGFVPANVAPFQTETRFEGVIVEIEVPLVDEDVPGQEVWINVNAINGDTDAADTIKPLVAALGTIDE